MKENTTIAIIMICVTFFGSQGPIIIDNSAKVDSLITEVSYLQSRVKYLEFQIDSIIKEDW